MKLLITGSTGFLGRRAAAHFEALGWEVLAPSHSQLELGSREAVRRWMAENRPEGVLHCAAVSDTGACQRQPEATARVNVDAAVHLAEACAETGAKLVFCSSDQVYAGSTLPGPHREVEILTPGNVYGCQKLLAEQRCLEIHPETVCLRLSWMYAAQALPQEHGQLVSTLLEALKDPSLPLSWPIHDRRGLTDTAAVAARLPLALELPGGVWNFGSENDLDTHHTLQAVFEALKLTGALARLVPNQAAFAEAPRDIRMDTGKCRAAGITFDTTREGLCRALAEALHL